MDGVCPRIVPAFHILHPVPSVSFDISYVRVARGKVGGGGGK